MATFAVYIEKSVAFMGNPNDVFGNTYHFNVDPATDIDDEALALAVADAERAVTELTIQFTRWVTWGPTDGAAVDNVMREDGILDFTGSVATVPEIYRTVCALVVWRLPRSPVTNRRRWLRKFLRSATGVPVDPAVISGQNPFPADAEAAFATYASAIRNVQVGMQDHLLSTEDGTVATAAGEVRPYMRTRQIGS